MKNMPDLITFGYMIAGVLLGYVYANIFFFSNKGAAQFVDALKKKKMIIFSETDKAEWFRVVDKVYKNLAVTTDKDMIILPENAIKPCMNLGGVQMAHADLYKSIASSSDVRKWMLSIKEQYGWTENDIAVIIQEIQEFPPEKVTEYLAKLVSGKATKKEEVITEVDDPENPGQKKRVKQMIEQSLAPAGKDKEKYAVYIALPSTVKNWVYTGLNRISIHDMLRELVYQRDLEKKGVPPWIMIGIAVFLVILALGFALPKILPILMQAGAATAIPAATVPASIAP